MRFLFDEGASAPEPFRLDDKYADPMPLATGRAAGTGDLLAAFGKWSQSYREASFEDALVAWVAERRALGLSIDPTNEGAETGISPQFVGQLLSCFAQVREQQRRRPRGLSPK